MISLNGSCHCGNINYDLSWPRAAMAARKCSCTFCQKHQASWTSHTDASLLVRIADPLRVSKYRFGTGTADFYVCATCGVATVVVSEIDDSQYAVVNVGTIDDIEQVDLSTTGTDFDGEGTDDRLERRKRNWIGQIRIEGAAT